MRKVTEFKHNLICVAFLMALFSACTKGEKRENNAGKVVDIPSDPSENPCLRLNLIDSDEDKNDENDNDESDNDNKVDEDDGVGSSSSSNDCGESVDPTNNEEKKNTSSAGKSYEVGPGIPGCEEKSEAWVAVKNGGAGVCEGTLVKWCCSAQEIASRFPNVADKLSPKITSLVDDGLKLYHCSEHEGNTIFHFAASKSAVVSYKTLFVTKTASKNGDTKGDSCPVVTMEDMGFGNMQDSGSEAKMPEAIGEIEDTTKEGILEFLKTNVYQSWRADSNFRESGTHGKVKIFFNKTLEKSLEGDESEHEVGSIAVKEIYSDSTLEGYAVMAKIIKGDSKDTWFFYEAIGGAPDFADVKAYSVGGPAVCTQCHTKGKDFIQSEMQ